MQRQSNNHVPKFTDEECITVYLWGIRQRRFEQKAIYNYVRNHLLEWFPKLPSYQAFCRRLGEMVPAFQALAEIWMEQSVALHNCEMAWIVDSCPIILAKQARSGRAKAASEICDKSYNSSRKEYYYGVKLHAFVARRTGKLPIPCTLMISHASDHDLTVARQIIDNQKPFYNGILYADKAYADSKWQKTLLQEYSVQISIPRKKKKYDSICSGDAVSTFVSSRRQPIECFFNWINAKTGIQTASKVRSTKGLFLHIFGRTAAALLLLCFNS